MSRNQFDKDKKLAILGFVCAALIICGIVIAKGQIVSRIKPVIAGAQIDEKKLTIVPENEEIRLVYCISESDNGSTCEWGNSREFNLEHDGTYYSFVKNLDTGAISEPYELLYKYIDFSKLGI